jgi:hypothetical protein
MELSQTPENIQKLGPNALSIDRFQPAGTQPWMPYIWQRPALILGSWLLVPPPACVIRDCAEKPLAWPGASSSPTGRVNSVVEAAKAVVQPEPNDVDVLANGAVDTVRGPAAGRAHEAGRTEVREAHVQVFGFDRPVV